MIPVYQEHDHDCMRACLASILEIDPKHLPAPHPAEMTPEEWNDIYWKALVPFNYWLVGVNGWLDIDPPGYYVGVWRCRFLNDTGKRVYPKHAVVMKGDMIVHDPIKPDLKTACSFTYLKKMALSMLVPIDPALHVKKRVTR